MLGGREGGVLGGGGGGVVGGGATVVKKTGRGGLGMSLLCTTAIRPYVTPTETQHPRATRQCSMSSYFIPNVPFQSF